MAPRTRGDIIISRRVEKSYSAFDATSTRFVSPVTPTRFEIATRIERSSTSRSPPREHRQHARASASATVARWLSARARLEAGLVSLREGRLDRDLRELSMPVRIASPPARCRRSRPSPTSRRSPADKPRSRSPAQARTGGATRTAALLASPRRWFRRSTASSTSVATRTACRQGLPSIDTTRPQHRRIAPAAYLDGEEALQPLPAGSFRSANAAERHDRDPARAHRSRCVKSRSVPLFTTWS